MKSFTNELMEKARAAQTPEELLTLAKENGVELTAEEAKQHLDQLHPASGELSDDELDNVAGGGCNDSSSEPIYDPIPGFGTHLYFRNGCPHCGDGSAYVYDSNESNWALVCNERCPYIRGSGRASFWGYVSKTKN